MLRCMCDATVDLWEGSYCILSWIGSYRYQYMYRVGRAASGRRQQTNPSSPYDTAQSSTAASSRLAQLVGCCGPTALRTISAPRHNLSSSVRLWGRTCRNHALTKTAQAPVTPALAWLTARARCRAGAKGKRTRTSRASALAAPTALRPRCSAHSSLSSTGMAARRSPTSAKRTSRRSCERVPSSAPPRTPMRSSPPSTVWTPC